MLFSGAATGMAECTFRPALNAHSERLLEDATNLPADFKARQAHFDAARKAKLDRLAAEKVRRRRRQTLLCSSRGAHMSLGIPAVHRFQS